MTSNHNFMLADFAGIGIAFLLFSVLTVFPGYTLGWALNVLRFRRREMFFRFAISVPLSIAVVPLASYLIGCWLSLSAACVLFAMLSVAAVPLLFLGRRRARKGPLLWVALAWCVWALLALSDLQIGRRLYFTIISFDYAVRTSFISSISTFGLPARNPFFYPGHAVAAALSLLLADSFGDGPQSGARRGWMRGKR